MGLDPRWTNLLAWTVGLILLARTTHAFALLSLFATLPYLIFRHDVYIGVCALWLVFPLVFLGRGWKKFAAVSFGWSLAAFPVSWVMLPGFLTAFRSGRRLLTACLAIVPAAIFVLPFLLTEPISFLEGVVGHWEDRVAVASFNFSQLFLTIMRIETLVILQVATVLALWLLAWRSNCRPAVSVAWMAFILLNRVVWAYLYLPLLLLFVPDSDPDGQRHGYGRAR